MMHLKLPLIPHGQHFGIIPIKDSQSDPSCLESQTFQYSVVWDVAVAGLAIVESRDISKTNDVATSLYKYQNSHGWFVATRGTLIVMLMIIVKYYGFYKLMN